jgi:hypothetical protein
MPDEHLSAIAGWRGCPSEWVARVELGALGSAWMSHDLSHESDFSPFVPQLLAKDGVCSMSVRLMGTVFYLDIDPSEKLVLLAMADHADDDGTKCFPSVARLSLKTSFSRRGVQKVIARLTKKGFLLAAGRRREGTIEYRIMVAKSERGSQGELRSQRTSGREGVNLSAERGEPSSPEPSLILKEPPVSRHPKRQGGDSRFQPIVKAYSDGTRRFGIEPTLDKRDFGALRDWLKETPESRMPLPRILATLENAFESRTCYPVQKGFKLREFIRHQEKYQLGPLHPVDRHSQVPATEESIPAIKVSV